VYLDPTQEELKAGSGSMMIAVMPSSQEVTQWWQEGRLKGTTAVKAIELCMDGAASMHALMKAKLTAIQE
jgi:exosome complex component MTR3